MTSGVPSRENSSAVEPWRQRTTSAVLRQKEQRIRQRVGELYAAAESARGLACTRLVRRSLAEAEHLLDLAADALRQDWLER